MEREIRVYNNSKGNIIISTTKGPRYRLYPFPTRASALRLALAVQVRLMENKGIVRPHLANIGWIYSENL
jgi:hypothetical protein